MNSTSAIIWFVGLAVALGSAIGLGLWCEMTMIQYQKRHTENNMIAETLTTEHEPQLRTYMVDSTDLGNEPPTTLELLRELVKDGEWHTTSEILGVGGHRSGLRRLRELRKEFEIDRRVVDGDSEYRVLGNRLNLDVSRTALTHTLALLETITDPQFEDDIPAFVQDKCSEVLALWPDQTK